MFHVVFCAETQRNAEFIFFLQGGSEALVKRAAPARIRPLRTAVCLWLCARCCTCLQVCEERRRAERNKDDQRTDTRRMFGVFSGELQFLLSETFFCLSPSGVKGRSSIRNHSETSTPELEMNTRFESQPTRFELRLMRRGQASHQE